MYMYVHMDILSFLCVYTIVLNTQPNALGRGVVRRGAPQSPS